MLLWKDLTKIKDIDVKEFSKKYGEGIHVEYKRQWTKDKIANIIASLANTQGGVIVFGIKTKNQIANDWPGVPIEGDQNWEDDIRRVSLNGVYPPIVPEIGIVPFKTIGSKDNGFVIVRIRESQEAPHAITNRKIIPVREESVNNPISTMDIDKIEWYLERRKRLADFRSKLIEDSLAIEKEISGEFLNEPRIEIVISPAFPHRPLIDNYEMWATINDSRIFNLLVFGELLLESRPVPNGVYSWLADEKNKPIRTLHVDKYGLIRFSHRLRRNMETPTTLLSDGQKRMGNISLETIHADIVNTYKLAIWYFNQVNWSGLAQIQVLVHRVKGMNLAGLPNTYGDMDFVSRVSKVGVKEFFTFNTDAETIDSDLEECLLKQLVWPFRVKKKKIEGYLKG